MLTFNGSSAQLYVNDVPRASRTYSATENDIAGKNYRIGYASDTTPTKYYFDGLIKDVYIYDKIPSADTTPPTPNPATWATVPYAVSSSEISMTATTGSDPSGPVEYYFDETTGNPGGTDSGWITSPTYNDTGLSPNTQYTYRVQMRDALQNTGSWSTSQSATTPAAVPTFVAAGTVASGTSTIRPALPSALPQVIYCCCLLRLPIRPVQLPTRTAGPGQRLQAHRREPEQPAAQAPQG